MFFYILQLIMNINLLNLELMFEMLHLLNYHYEK